MDPLFSTDCLSNPLLKIMKPRPYILTICFLSAIPLSTLNVVSAAPKVVAVPLSPAGATMEKQYAETLKTLRAEIERALPKIGNQEISAFEKARAASKAAEADAEKAGLALGKIHAAKGLIDHAKGKWIGGAEKEIARAEAALKKASTEAEKQAAAKDIAKWQANKEEGIKALKERQEAYDQAKSEEPKLSRANQAAVEALAKARASELAAARTLMSKLEPVVSSDKLDAHLVKCTVMAEATPSGLAAFAQQGDGQVALLENLLSNLPLMKQMLVEGGAKFGEYGRAMEIYTAIRKISSGSAEGVLHRLALATSLEHAKPIEQSNPVGDNAPSHVDPVQRYLHYEKAFLGGELDPAFKSFNTWELRMVVGCDAPDSILAWGREMLRNYRPDHITNPDYGWRYSSTVRTEVPYGSQNVKDDVPSLHKYQNIIMNGGVCGRRAFFGRYILQCFGIPTWGVTQKAHAALSHWTPKGWVVNFGAGFERSWWDKDEAPRSGSDFLLETQARAHGEDYLKVLRSRWISRSLGELAFNDRKRVTGGFWSNMAHYQEANLASSAIKLGPLGQELAEANESKVNQKVQHAKLSEEARKITISEDGVVSIPAVAHGKATGSGLALESMPEGFQLHCTGGFKTEYEWMAPKAGKYLLTATVVTVQRGQKFMLAVNQPTSPIEIPVPYTIGKWDTTAPVEVSLVKGSNFIYFALQDGSRGVSIKQFNLTPVK
jgi:hypothetical protein